MTYRFPLLILAASLLIYSCSSTEGVVDTTSSDNGLFPGWYSSTGFQVDSASFSGFGVAIAADSSVAIKRATEDALKNLDLEIGKKAENVRTQLENEGSGSVSNTDFILILRNAHSDAINEAILSEHSVVLEKSIFRAFAKVELTKSGLKNQLEIGFSGHPRYWAAYSDNDTFRSTFE